MSFNLNKLVQPECGASNPLVSAAQQISNPHHGARMRLPTPQAPVNFAQEFLQQHQTQILSQEMNKMKLAGNQMLLPSSSRSTLMPSMMNHGPMLHVHNLMQHNQENNSSITAGDQLETKYRNDMISQSKEKLDDVAFWQSLSQKYTGPTTYDAMAKAKVEKSDATNVDGQNVTTSQQEDEAQTNTDLHDSDYPTLEPDLVVPSLEYIFDERNPLKDQFEDPFAEGLKKLEQGDIPSAVLLFEAAVQLKPEDAVAWRYLGSTQALNENDQSAIKALRNCIKLNEGDQQARLAIAVSLANESERREACRHLLEWLLRHEKYNAVGASLEDFDKFSHNSFDPWMTNYDKSPSPYSYVRDKFLEAARMSPTNPDPQVQNSLGVLFNLRGEYEKAVDCFKAALSVRSDDSVLWNRLGATLANGNKSDEAVVAYRKALEISPGFLRTRYNLAISLVHLNIYDEAAKQLVQILNMQAAGKGSNNSQIRTRSITSSTIWNTLRTVTTLQNKPELYPIIDGRDLARCNEILLKQDGGGSSN